LACGRTTCSTVEGPLGALLFGLSRLGKLGALVQVF